MLLVAPAVPPRSSRWPCRCVAAAPAQSIQSLEQAASAARDAGNTDEAIRDYSRIVALRPDSAEDWWNLGTTQYQANRYSDAVASLRKLTQLAPNAAEGWDMLGLSQFETKDYAAALASLKKARSLGGKTKTRKSRTWPLIISRCCLSAQEIFRTQPRCCIQAFDGPLRRRSKQPWALRCFGFRCCPLKLTPRTTR